MAKGEKGSGEKKEKGAVKPTKGQFFVSVFGFVFVCFFLFCFCIFFKGFSRVHITSANVHSLHFFFYIMFVYEHQRCNLFVHIRTFLTSWFMYEPILFIHELFYI